MGQVIPLKREDDGPTLSGDAHCMACGRKWVAVCPIGTVWLECPECGSMKGLMNFPVTRDIPLWTCNCGNDLFRATQDGFYCPNCGEWQHGF